jgi:hypothetical protein
MNVEKNANLEIIFKKTNYEDGEFISDFKSYRIGSLSNLQT